MTLLEGVANPTNPQPNHEKTRHRHYPDCYRAVQRQLFELGNRLDRASLLDVTSAHSEQDWPDLCGNACNLG